MKTKELIDIVFRYLLILLLAIGNLAIFYLIFTPLTVYPVFWLLKIFYTISINGNNLTEVINALEESKKRNMNPIAIIANTIKSKGVSFMEGDPKWHHGVLNDLQYKQAINELINE